MVRRTRKPATTRRASARERQPEPLDLGLDQALIALFIGAMNANLHVAVDEAARAQYLIGATRRFRRTSHDVINRLIDDMRDLLERNETNVVIDAAVGAIPARLRPSAFAVLTDLVLADGKIDARERRFLAELGSKLAMTPADVQQVVEVVLLKNRL